VGTAQLITTLSGTVCYDSDNTPFGDINAYTTTCSQNYNFAGMERDTETANDHTLYRGYKGKRVAVGTGIAPPAR
jgi:hypothetical protein